jgi:hypothetical protein
MSPIDPIVPPKIQVKVREGVKTKIAVIKRMWLFALISFGKASAEGQKKGKKKDPFVKLQLKYDDGDDEGVDWADVLQLLAASCEEADAHRESSSCIYLQICQAS